LKPATVLPHQFKNNFATIFYTFFEVHAQKITIYAHFLFQILQIFTIVTRQKGLLVLAAAFFFSLISL